MSRVIWNIWCSRKMMNAANASIYCEPRPGFVILGLESVQCCIICKNLDLLLAYALKYSSLSLKKRCCAVNSQPSVTVSSRVLCYWRRQQLHHNRAPHLHTNLLCNSQIPLACTGVRANQLRLLNQAETGRPVRHAASAASFLLQAVLTPLPFRDSF